MYGISPRSEAASGTGISQEKPYVCATKSPPFQRRALCGGRKTRGKREGGEVFASIARDKEINKEKTEA